MAASYVAFAYYCYNHESSTETDDYHLLSSSFPPSSRRTTTMTATAAALKRLEALFEDVKLADDGGGVEPAAAKTKRASVEKVHFAVTADCDLHGAGRRKSEHLHQHHHRGSISVAAPGPRRDSVPASIPAASMRRRDSIVLGSPGRDTLCHHPSSFPSSLRRDSLASSTSSLRRDSVNAAAGRRDSLTPPSTPLHATAAAGVVLRRESTGTGRKDSVPAWRRFSTDSLDSVRRNSWDPSRRGSSGSSAGCEDPIWEETATRVSVCVCVCADLHVVIYVNTNTVCCVL